MRRREETHLMNLGHYSRSQRSWALGLAITMLTPTVATALLPATAWAQTAAPTTATDLAAIPIPTAPPAVGPIHTILMFPFTSALSASGGSVDGAIVGAQVEDAIKMRLNVIGRYKADSFSPRLPQIQRAVSEAGVAGITETDIAPPYDTSQKGRKLADEIATDGYLLGTVEALQTDPQTREVSLTVTATLYNTETGRAVKALAYTGHGVSYSASDDPSALLQSAVNDAAGKVASALNADTAQGLPAASAPDVVARAAARHHSGIGAVALGILVAAAIAIGVTASHHSSHHSGSGTTTTTSPVTGGGGLPPNPPNAP